MNHIARAVAEAFDRLTRDPENNWQPADFLPDLASDEGFEQVRALREQARAIPENVLVVLVGDMITEEALPTYASWLAAMDGANDSATPASAWDAWNRAWCGEENRHGDLLNRYLYLTGRVNMREVETTIQHLIRDGGDIQTENDPYRTFIYTSFQEIATRLSHVNVGKLARTAGVDGLHRLCAKIAGDEHRHARAYRFFISRILEIDPNNALLAFQDMMKKKITMPAMHMRERGAEIGSAFEKFEAVATRIGVYTPHDYVAILEELVEGWKVATLTGLSPAAEKAQDYLCSLAGRYRKILERVPQHKATAPLTFSWLNVPNPTAAS